MFNSFRLLIISPIKRFLSQALVVSTEPSRFAISNITLGDGSSLLRSAKFFGFGLSAAFALYNASLQILGAGNEIEIYYFAFISVFFLIFVTISFLTARLVSPCRFIDVLQVLSYPVSASFFVGTLVTLISSAVIALCVFFDVIPDIRTDFTTAKNFAEAAEHAYRECAKQESLAFQIIYSGLQGAFERLEEPIASLSYITPTIILLYVLGAAKIMAAVYHEHSRKMYALVVCSFIVSIALLVWGAKTYMDYHYSISKCGKEGIEFAQDQTIEDRVKKIAQEMQNEPRQFDPILSFVSTRAEQRSLITTYQFKKKIIDKDKTYEYFGIKQRQWTEKFCRSSVVDFFRKHSIKDTQIYRTVDGQHFHTFTISTDDCRK